MEFLVLGLAIVVLPVCLLLWQRADNYSRRQRFIDKAAHQEHMEYLRTEALPAQLAIEQEKTARQERDQALQRERIEVERQRVQAMLDLSERIEPPTPKEIGRVAGIEHVDREATSYAKIRIPPAYGASQMPAGGFYCATCHVHVPRGMAHSCLY